MKLNKIIWILWLQGWDQAPWLVRQCLASWQKLNPSWDIRVLDAKSLRKYIILDDLLEPDVIITSASVSDIIRSALLYEYGGIWVDSTVVCHRPLDEWIYEAVKNGFFAFDKPAPDRPLASWFLAASSQSPIIKKWHKAVIDYWKGRKQADAYFWFHYQFKALCEHDPDFASQWAQVPKISADGPHKIQWVGLLASDKDVINTVVQDLPAVSKLTYRFDQEAMTKDSLVYRLLSQFEPAEIRPNAFDGDIEPTHLASLKVSTQNLGDHIQIYAAQALLNRCFAIQPEYYIDRDNDIRSVVALPQGNRPFKLIMNGWYKTNRAEWPPSPKLDPLFIGFHIRLFQCPELISPEALDYYKSYEPIGARDPYSLNLLRDNGIESYLSHCLTISLPKRIECPESQTEIFVVSRDEQILDHLPKPISQQAHYICHYSDSFDFEDNMIRAVDLLNLYKSKAKLIITSLLHCALPAMAMGIPVIMLYPVNSESGHRSDIERLSGLAQLITIYDQGEIETIDWNPQAIDLSQVKFDLINKFFEGVNKWNWKAEALNLNLAPSSVLPPA